jgi:hypothetical protein
MKIYELIKSRSTLNSRYRIICTESRPCKRMFCVQCYKKRRAFFISKGRQLIVHNKLDCFATLSLTCDTDGPWGSVTRVTPKLSKQMSGKIGKYIRCISIGEGASTPHIHYILSKMAGEKLDQITFVMKERSSFCKEKIFDSSGVLGYMFDQNFMYTFLLPDRPRRIRLLSASRQMPCGFPKKFTVAKTFVSKTSSVLLPIEKKGSNGHAKS